MSKQPRSPLSTTVTPVLSPQLTFRFIGNSILPTKWHICRPFILYLWIYLKGLYFLPLIYMSILMLIQCLDYCSSIVSLELKRCKPFNFVFQIVSTTLGLLYFHIKFEISISISSNLHLPRFSSICLNILQSSVYMSCKCYYIYS